METHLRALAPPFLPLTGILAYIMGSDPFLFLFPFLADNQWNTRLDIDVEATTD